jgi:hypothetical protein
LGSFFQTVGIPPELARRAKQPFSENWFRKKRLSFAF